MNPERIPVNDLRTSANEKSALAAAVNRTLERGWYVNGPELEAFEHEFAAHCGADYCIGVANGTDALTLALAALNLAPGSLVATVANAGGYASTAIARNGLTPCYIDVDESGLMSAIHLEVTLNQLPPAAIILTHLYGNSDGAARVAKLGRDRAIPLIEDCAQAHGAMTSQGRVGSLGEAGCFSFYPTKNLGGIGDGGAVTTSNHAIAEQIKSLRNYGWRKQRYVSEGRGYNSRLDEIQAAVLRLRLETLDTRNDRRREIAACYLAAMSNPSLAMGRTVEPHDVFHLFVVKTSDREQTRTAFDEIGITTDVHYPVPDYQQPRFSPYASESVTLEATDAHCRNVLTIPCYPSMEQQQVDRVCEALRIGWL